MTMHMSRSLRRRFGIACLVVLGGCSKDDILRPDVPDVIDPETLTNPQSPTACHWMCCCAARRTPWCGSRCAASWKPCSRRSID